MIQIPQSATRRVLLNLFTTGTTTKATGKTVAVVLSKAGGAFANPSAGATNATELSNGWYYVDLSTTDTNTLGDLVVRGTASGCDDTERLFGVVKATNGGLTGVPDAVAGAVNGLPLGDASGRVLLQPTQTGVTIPTVTAVTNGVTVTTNNDKTGYSLSQSFPSNFAALSIDASGRIDLGKWIGTAPLALNSQLVQVLVPMGGIADMPANWPAMAIAPVTGYVSANTLQVGGVDVEPTDVPIAADLQSVLGTSLTEGGSGRLAAAFKKLFDVATPLLMADAVIPTTAQIADKLLGRNIAGGSDGGRTVSEAFYVSRNKVVRTATTLTVYDVSDSSVSWTATLTNDANLNPLASVDPA